MADYVREAFFFRWNLLLFAGGAAAAVLTPLAPVLLPLVAAGELAYLTGLVSIPRFRAAIDAKMHGGGASFASESAPAGPAPSLLDLLSGLQADARKRFERLHSRCVEMRTIAAGVRGATEERAAASEEMRTPGLDRLLWLFLRLLVSKTALDRFLQTMNEAEITTRLADLRKSFETAKAGGDDRVVRSLQDSIAMAELRLDNFGAGEEERRFRLDRARSDRRQDPDAGGDGREPPGSGLPEQPGGLGGREHAADGKGRQRAPAPDRTGRPARGAAADHGNGPARSAA